MTKYTRSIEKLSKAIEDIFDVEGISIDTKAIALILAATMSPNRFRAMIEPIADLGYMRLKLIEINTFRARFGSVFRNYIILHALQAAKREISSDELQRFIRDSGQNAKPGPLPELTQALNSKTLQLKTVDLQNTDHKTFAITMKNATDYLVDNLVVDEGNEANAIIETYLHCRSKLDPHAAYYAVVHAVASILEADGIEIKDSMLNSYKLTKHALQIFITDFGSANSMLHTYKALQNK